VSHSTKRARRTVHRQRLLCRVLFLGHSAQTLPSARHYSTKKSRRHGVGVTETALCQVSPNTLGIEVTLCRGSAGQHSAKNPSAGPHVRFFDKCFIWHSTKRASLPSARATTLDNPGLGSLPSAMVLTLGKAPLCRVLHSAK
jgi:hypothetical protein